MNDPRVAAIRADKLFGEGTCSVIDECYTDEELLEAFTLAQVNTVTQALRWARRRHTVWADQVADAENSAF